jgi:Na+/H+ antiporter NhaD/arsenite permease-like protein
MDPVVVVVFLLVYVGMIVGEIPQLRIDRTGFALLGAIVLIATGRMTTKAAWAAIDVPTIALLFGLMVMSAQFRLGGFYAALTRRLGGGEHTPAGLLALVIIAAGVLSAVLANDIVCLAMAPVIVEIATARRLDPIPYLLALACAANVGSAGTLIGNPQNMLIGQTLDLSFSRYLLDGGVPALAGLGLVWVVISLVYRRRWAGDVSPVQADTSPFDRWQTIKGAVVVSVVMVLFVFSPWPREAVALAGAGVLLVSRKTGLASHRAVCRPVRGKCGDGAIRARQRAADGRPPRRRGSDDAGIAVRDRGGAVEYRVERTGGDAAPAGRAS